MKTKAKNVEDCATLFEIELPKETIDKAFVEIYGEITKIANIPGFRTGHAPTDLVKKHYVKDAKDEVLKRLIPDAYRRALSEHKISPIGLPEISDIDFEEGKALFFKIRVETHPKFKLKDYKGIKVVRKKAVIRDEDVAKALANLRELYAKYIAVEDRPVQLGDYVVGDLDCSVDGKPIHKKRENIWLYIDKESFIPGLTEKMAGMAKNEERDIELTLPDKYPDKKLAGKKASYHVKVREIKSKSLQNLDDEFAKTVGKDSLDALKKDIKDELERRALVNMEVDMENQILNKLAEENVFSVPTGLVKKQISLMVDDAKARLEEKGFRKEDLAKKDKEFAEKFDGDARRQVRLLFILDEIARLENISANDEEIKESYRRISIQTGKTEKEVREYYDKEDLVDNLKEKIKEEKTIKFLLDNAQVIEKTD